jgi:PAS domain S-box-containing protein
MLTPPWPPARASRATLQNFLERHAPSWAVDLSHPRCEQKPRTPTGRGLVALSVIVIAGILALLAADLHGRYLAALAEAKRAAQNAADVLAEYTGRGFDALNLTLDAAELVRKNAAAGPYPMVMAHGALRLLQHSTPGVIAIGWTNAEGDVVAHSYEGDPPRPNIADLPYFAAQRDGDGSRLLIAQPFRSVASGRWIVAISRRLSEADGRFAGIISAPIDPGHFAGVYKAVKPGANGAVALMSSDGVMLAREPFVDSAVGRSYADTALFTQHLRRSDSGTFESVSSVDGTPRIVAYRAIPQFALVLGVTYDRAEALQPWYEHARTVVPLAAVLIAVLILGAVILSRQSRTFARQSRLHQDALQASELRYRSLVEDQSEMVSLASPDGTLLFVNHAYARHHRLQPADMVGRSLFDFIPQAEHDNVARHLSDVRSAHQSLENQNQLLTPEGELRWTAWTNRALRGGDGEVTAIHSVGRDIELHVAAEQRLKESEARYRLLAEHSTDMVFQIDDELVRRYVSPACREILGYAPEELIGTRPVNMIHPDDAPRVEAIYRLVLNGKDRASVTNRIRHRDGHWVWVEATLRLVRDPDGRPTGVQGSLRDISARKTIEAELTAAREQAERAAAAQGQFLATMSHELRTPLNSVIGFADIILERRDLVPELRRQVSLIQTAGTFLLTTVNDVLDFSKIEEGKLEIVTAAFSLPLMIDACTALVRSAAANKRLVVSVRMGEDIPPFVSGDESRLRQVLLNLLNNAVKFTPSGFVILSVERAGPGQDGGLCFSVSDSGIGIPGEKLGQLFQRFTQVDGSTSREFGGSGLGLAICKRLIELMGGEIGVESTLGEGSTFWFKLTLPAALPPAMTAPDETAHRSSVAPLHILVVDDLDMNQEVARSMLEAAGHQVDAVSDGAAAIHAVLARDYDLVLMDVQMAGMDGVTATRRIRALPAATRGVPIIAMTANVLAPQIESFRLAGMNGHLAKPLRRDDLLAAVGRLSAKAPPAAPGGPLVEIAAPGTLDTETFAQVVTDLGEEKTRMFLSRLEVQLRTQLSADPASYDGRARLAAEAHKLTSAAGMFGFMALSDCCGRLEAAAAGNRDDLMAVLDETRAACAEALTEIRCLLQSDGGEGRLRA